MYGNINTVYQALPLLTVHRCAGGEPGIEATIADLGLN